MPAADPISHLLRKTTFFVGPEDLQRYRAMGLEATVESLLQAEPEPVWPGEVPPYSHKPAPGESEAMFLAWLHRMTGTRAQLRERLTLFWHNHFATALHKVSSPHLMARQVGTLRELGMNRFEELLLAVTRDPAMLVWLDGISNRRAEPNENYAREVMELFTLSIGHFTEDDVQELARAFTGWRVDKETGDPELVAREHDRAFKLILGQTGRIDDVAAVRLLATRPETARLLATKLWAAFAYPAPGEEVEPLVRAYLETDGDIRAVLRSMFLAPAFYSERAQRAVIRQPAEWVAGVLRAVGLPPDKWVLPFLRRMGQELFNPPSVAGWPGGPAWLGSTALLARWHFGWAVAAAAEKQGLLPPMSGTETLAYWVDRLGLDGLSAMSREALAEFSGATFTEKGARAEHPRLILQAVLACPEFQLA